MSKVDDHSPEEIRALLAQSGDQVAVRNSVARWLEASGPLMAREDLQEMFNTLLLSGARDIVEKGIRGMISRARLSEMSTSLALAIEPHVPFEALLNAAAQIPLMQRHGLQWSGRTNNLADGLVYYGLRLHETGRSREFCRAVTEIEGFVPMPLYAWAKSGQPDALLEKTYGLAIQQGLRPDSLVEHYVISAVSRRNLEAVLMPAIAGGGDPVREAIARHAERLHQHHDLLTAADRALAVRDLESVLLRHGQRQQVREAAMVSFALSPP